MIPEQSEDTESEVAIEDDVDEGFNEILCVDDPTIAPA